MCFVGAATRLLDVVQCDAFVCLGCRRGFALKDRNLRMKSLRSELLYKRCEMTYADVCCRTEAATYFDRENSLSGKFTLPRRGCHSARAPPEQK